MLTIQTIAQFHSRLYWVWVFRRIFLVYFPTFSRCVSIISTGHLALVSQTLRLPFYPKIKGRWLFQTLIYIGQYRCMWRFFVIFRKREAEAADSFEFSTKYTWLCMQSYLIFIKSWVGALGMRPAACFISKTPLLAYKMKSGQVVFYLLIVSFRWTTFR